MNREAFRIDALRRFDHDGTVRTLLEDATTFELFTLECLDHIQCGRLVIAREVSVESREAIGEFVGLAKLATEGKFRNTYQQQADGSCLIGAAMLPGPSTPPTEGELQCLT